MASSISVVLILLGGFIMAIGYQTVSQCLSRYSNNPLCWSIFPAQNRYSYGPLGFYAGTIVVILGAVMLVGGDVAKLLRKSRRPGSDSQR